MGSLRSQTMALTQTEEAGTALIASSLFPLVDIQSSTASLLSQFPNLSPRVVIALAIAQLLSRSVTPFRLCECGCGEPIHGKSHFASQACRKREQRRRDAERDEGPRQFGLVLQSEFNIRAMSSPPPKADTDADTVSLNAANCDTLNCDTMSGNATLPFEFLFASWTSARCQNCPVRFYRSGRSETQTHTTSAAIPRSGAGNQAARHG